MRFNKFNIINISIVIVLFFSACKKNEGGGPAISGLACSSVSYTASATQNTAYSATATVPYTGGNGVSYGIGTTISSREVTGFTATLQAGSLYTGNGNLSYTINGIATDTGYAYFDLSFGGQSCSIKLHVGAAGGGSNIPAVFSQIYGAYSITFDGTFVTIKSYDQPDCKSVYWPTNNALYEAFSGPTFNDSSFIRAPGNIVSQNITLKIPAYPVAAATHASTPMGVIGIGIDGVPFFNQYAAGGVAIAGEIHGFDQWWSHPQMSGMYHHHVEPKYLTTVRATKSSLMGFLLDGFPVYGTLDPDQSTPSNLDAYHGHTHATPDYPGGIYHYHFSATYPYLNGNGFWGTAGIVTQ